MDKKKYARRIGYQIGLIFAFGVMVYGIQLHRLFPFGGPVIGIILLLVILQIVGKRYGKYNQSKLNGLQGDHLLEQQIIIAKNIRTFVTVFLLFSLLSFLIT